MIDQSLDLEGSRHGIGGRQGTVHAGPQLLPLFALGNFRVDGSPRRSFFRRSWRPILVLPTAGVALDIVRPLSVDRENCVSAVFAAFRTTGFDGVADRQAFV